MLQIVKDEPIITMQDQYFQQKDKDSINRF